ncbi:hypothetical protein [Thermus albus]|uniref:hypothetical protein n=1 Tax=Thermus albus TaxID=2908146 RepID=UPI001FA9B1F2|nr:hypothetical protein [Thermus albus]
MTAEALLQSVRQALEVALPGWTIAQSPESRGVPTVPTAYVLLGPARLTTHGYDGYALLETLQVVLLAPISGVTYAQVGNARDQVFLALMGLALPEVAVESVDGGAVSPPVPVEEGAMAWRVEVSLAVRRSM